MARIAVVLFNLGGPDSLDAVQPFLTNLFSDPAIIGAPGLIRWYIARKIARKRAPQAREIYAHLGGCSPLLEQTAAQAQALERFLSSENADSGRQDEVKCFVCMRYWHPMTREVVRSVKEWRPDQVVLLPLYPQYSMTTSGSSLKLWRKEAHRQSLNRETKTVCCYPSAPGFVAAQADLLKEALAKAGSGARVLFSAHGLPKMIIEKGDPYQAHVERGAAAIAEAAGLAPQDWLVCYQSKVGPLEWLGPDTPAEIERAGQDGKAVVVLPLAFVSEHSETLVELDIDYAELAHKAGVARYVRVPAVQTHPAFIVALADLVRSSLDGGQAICGQSCHPVCPASATACAMLER